RTAPAACAQIAMIQRGLDRLGPHRRTRLGNSATRSYSGWWSVPTKILVPSGIVMLVALANSLPFLAAKPSTLMTAPNCIELFFQTRRSSALGGLLSIAQFANLAPGPF